MFVHLHVHSHYSFLDGASSPEELCAYAKELGYDALALTDTNGLYGALAFAESAKETGLRPIFGAELTSSLPPRWHEDSAVVLAKTDQGFSELCQLITARQLNPHFNLIAALGQSTAHVVVLAGSLALAQAIRSQRRCGGVYLEVKDLSEHGQPGKVALAVQQAAAVNLPAVASNCVHFAYPHEHAVHRALRSVHEHVALNALAPDAAFPGTAYLRPPQDMRRIFHHVPAILERAEELAKACCGKPGKAGQATPYDCPPGETEFSYLTKICFAGLHARCAPVRPELVKRLTRELEVIERKGFSGYFLVVWDIAQAAKRRGIPTVGRGSAANSMVAYCLGITHVNPLRHGLFFERFLNPEREDPPDIDLDFPWDQRDEMLDYAYARFGRTHVAMICTVVRLQARSAVREAGRVLGLSEQEISGFCSRLPYFGRVEDIASAQRQIPECRDLPLRQEPWRTVLALAEKLDGAPRHVSVHPGGMIIAPQPVARFMPKAMSAKGVEVTQYDMHGVEDSGFVKIDLLGQRGLAVIRDASRAAAVDWDQVDPTQDEATKQLLREGRTLGCFYVESPAMRLLLRKLCCDDFELLTAASSIIRPGVSNSGMMRMFVDRHLGRKPVRFAHPCLKPLLQDTYGVMVYQEDVIKVVNAVAGMSLGEADKLRRCMSKKRHWQKMDTYRERFFSGAKQCGVGEAAAKEIWRQIEAFGGYAFCKAHSASYAQLSFQAAYLKAHYPALFMAAVLSNQGGFYSPAAYWEEARRMGIRVLPPSINRSQGRYTVEDGGIRMGLLAIDGLKTDCADRVIAERKNHGVFGSIRDLITRTRITFDSAEKIITAGACDEWGGNRPHLMWELVLTGVKRRPPANELELNLGHDQAVPPVEDWTEDEKLAGEYQQLRMSPRSHPLVAFRTQVSALAGPGTVAAVDLIRFAGQRVRLYGWLVTGRRTRVQKTNEMMKFMTLEDFTGLFEVTLFPRVYREYGHCLAGHGPYLVEGVVKNDCGGITITAERIENLSCETEGG